MKKVLFFVLFLTSEHLLLSQNLILNPGFESWETTTRPASWIKTDNCLCNSTIFNSGSFSCQHSGGVSSRSDLGQTVTITPGKAYTLSYFNKTAANSGSGSRIWCDWKDIDGNTIEDPVSKPLIQPTKFLKNETWQQFTVNITAPENAVAFYLEVRTYTNSIAWWDDFVFEETVETGNYEMYVLTPHIYPNPASNTLNINNIQQLQHIDIQSLSGITVWSSEFSGENEVIIPVYGLTDGLYIIRILSPGKCITRIIIKN